jgi:hypothetical protein
MAKNAEFRAALEGLNATTLTDAGKAAIHALLNTDPTNPGAFRAAIIAHKAFWETLPNLAADPAVPTLYTDSEAFLEAAPAATPHNHFTELYHLAAQQRVALGLSGLTEPELQTLITSYNPAGVALPLHPAIAVRNLLVSNPQYKVATGNLDTLPRWSVNNEDVLSNNAVAAIVSAAVKKHMEDEAANFFTAHYLTPPGTLANAANLLNLDDANFVLNLPAPYTNRLLPADASAVKKIVGQQYVLTRIKQVSVNTLQTVASTSDPAALRGTPIKGGLNDAAAALAITDENVATLRNLAASKTIRFYSSWSNDPVALDALAKAKTGAELATVLESHPGLGFSGPGANAAFRDAAKLIASTREIQTTAQVRKDLISHTSADLEEFIAGPWAPGAAAGVHGLVNVPALATAYFDKFRSPGLTQALLVDYFNNPEHVLALRQQALLHVAKDRFAAMPDATLDTFIRAGGVDSLQAPVSAMLGDARADTLVQGPPNTGFNKLLVAYALVQRRVNAAKQGLHLGTLANDINNLATDGAFSMLPPSEHQPFQARLTQALVEHFPMPDAAALARLMAVANAADEAAFKTALTGMGVTSHTWVTPGTMETVQKAACLGALKRHIHHHSRPELIQLLSTLPLSDQRKILAEPDKFIPAILNAKSAKTLATILNLDESKITPELSQENQRVISIKKIFNAEIARCLAIVNPPIALDQAMLDQINGLLSARMPAALDFTDPGYPAAVGQLRAVVGPTDIASFNQAFGLDAAGALDANPEAVALRTRVRNQHTYNGPLFGLNTAPYPAHQRDFIHFLMALEKGRAITAVPGRGPSETMAILNALIGTTSRKEFLQDASINALDEVTKRSLKAALTQDKYHEFKQGFERDKFLNPAQVMAAIASGQSMLDQANVLDKLEEVDIGLENELVKLSKLTDISWLSPEFQATVMQDASRFKERINPLATACDAIVQQYEHQRKRIEEQLACLPDPVTVRGSALTGDQRRALESHRRDLQDESDRLRKRWELYHQLKLRLHGNPSATDDFGKKGVMGVVNEALAGKIDITRFFGYNSSYKDYDLDKKEALLKTGAGRDPLAPGDLIAGVGGGAYVDEEKAHYAIADKVKPGQFREYTIGNDERTKGCFIEERLATDMITKTEKGEELVLPKARYTVSKFPTAAEDRAVFAMAFANQILRDRDANPALKNHPIVLRQGTPEQLAYVWTALMLIGEKNPELNINKKTIRVDSNKFKPDDAINMFGKLKGEAYESIKKIANLDDILGHFRATTKEKFQQYKEERREIAKVTRTLDPLNKVIEGDLKRDIVAENEEELPTLRPR